MDIMELLQQIFQVCIIPLLGVLTAYLVAFIRDKMALLKKENESELYQKYMDMLTETIINCVIATNQTYVEALKNKNAFDAEAQKQAFELTYNAVINILSQEAFQYLNNIIGDLDEFIRKMIEAQVNMNKMPKNENKEDS